MKFISILLLALSLNTQAETIFTSVIDLRNETNEARIPTKINAGLYSVTTTLEASEVQAIDNIQLSRSLFRDDNFYTCIISGDFKVGTAKTTIKSLTSDWQQTITTEIVASFGTTDDDSECLADSRFYEGMQNISISPSNISINLPVNDARFTEIKLSLSPLTKGFTTSYELLAGKTEQSLKVLNPGHEFKKSLEQSTNNQLSYALSLTASGYYHFPARNSEAKKIK